MASRRRLRSVLESRQLAIALQPIIDVQTGMVASAEALARFPDTRPPLEWFVEAYDSNLGTEFELHAVAAALATVDRLPSAVRLAINVSPELALDPRLAALLFDSGVPLQRVVLEITEHTAVAHYPSVCDALLPLRGRGVGIAVDDAGAGYASFAHVVQLRPEIVKLDRSLIAGIHCDPAARAFVTGIVLLALDLGAAVVAEGVETPEQQAQLEALGIDYLQGYLLAPPTTDPAEWLSWGDRLWGTGAGAIPDNERIGVPRTIRV
jgi:EAL domain-containing protein (putative c-di-GMP-specific phosphodiesterase class I)